jgi:4-hydroxy-2,2'-bipyrrole-5-methanol synthase
VEELTKSLAHFKKQEACTLFSSGYAANVGFISGVMRPGDHIFLDQYSHASIVDGATLSKAEIRYFRHNNPQDLAQKLKDVKGKKLVIVEGLYSMDGDICPLPEIVEVSKRYGARILIDEAHSSFIFGENGGGIVEHFGVGEEVDFHMGTFSKALGGIGGYVCGSHALIHYLDAYSRSRFFSCTLPPAVIAGILTSLKLIQEKPEIRRKLWNNVNYMHHLFKEKRINIGNSVSQIIPVMLNDDVKAFAIAEKIREAGVFLQPATYPGVPKGKSRLRISVSANHSKQEIEKSIQVIHQTLDKYGIL